MAFDLWYILRFYKNKNNDFENEVCVARRHLHMFLIPLAKILYLRELEFSLLKGTDIVKSWPKPS